MTSNRSPGFRGIEPKRVGPFLGQGEMSVGLNMNTLVKDNKANLHTFKPSRAYGFRKQKKSFPMHVYVKLIRSGAGPF